MLSKKANKIYFSKRLLVPHTLASFEFDKNVVRHQVESKSHSMVFRHDILSHQHQKWTYQWVMNHYIAEHPCTRSVKVFRSYIHPKLTNKIRKIPLDVGCYKRVMYNVLFWNMFIWPGAFVMPFYYMYRSVRRGGIGGIFVSLCH